jgi:hypothetical protein
VKDFIFETTVVLPDNVKANDTNCNNLYNETLRDEIEKPRNTSSSKCLKDLQRRRIKYNIEICFYRKSDQVIFVYTRRLHNHPSFSNGIVYLFFFDENNNIRKVYRSIWIE